jgi:hypothetical protein
MVKLPNDIEPIIQIPDNSLYFFIGIILGIILLIYFFYKILTFFKKDDELKKIFLELENLDWKKTKETAYKITRLGRKIAGKQSSQMFDNLIKLLEQYKYRKTVEPINNEIKQKFFLFLEIAKNESKI